MSDVPWTEASAIGVETAHATWALAARLVLEDVAAEYHRVIELNELGDAIQAKSRIRTRSSARHWIGDVLWRTMEDNAKRREPFLSALAVDRDGHVWSGFAGCVEHLRGSQGVDGDAQAAEERLDCYRAWGAQLPPGGGEPGPWPSVVARRFDAEDKPKAARAAKPRATKEPRAAKPSAPARVAKTDVMPKVCERCFIALPASGLCDNCD